MFSCRIIFEQITSAFSFRTTNPEQDSFLWLLNEASKFILSVGPFGVVHPPDCNLHLGKWHSQNRCSLISAPL
ncbi:hypothetical protein E1A91_A02G097900v1 [Gossypium mustelinum]|uniref:Uncharacterized protein n=1 Tax=Gossypium mustelinum TaxID=34275 RepID=A0A5D3A3H3_GOSMU|nr:hypothetical protein E1A91_A02G097900v1 [Gossypium mustelinum]